MASGRELIEAKSDPGASEISKGAGRRGERPRNGKSPPTTAEGELTGKNSAEIKQQKTLAPLTGRIDPRYEGPQATPRP
jgi:hypothetical protein